MGANALSHSVESIPEPSKRVRHSRPDGCSAFGSSGEITHRAGVEPGSLREEGRRGQFDNRRMPLPLPFAPETFLLSPETFPLFTDAFI